MVRLATARYRAESSKGTNEWLPRALWSLIDLDRLYAEPEFDSLRTTNARAEDLRRLVQSGKQLDRGDHLWLNRCLADESYRQATGDALFKSLEIKFDAVIVSDAGKQFTVSRRTKGSGLVGTAMRASDIVMDRVWQLECDHFRAAPDFIFAPMKTTVPLADDPTALHPEIQHQVTNARTDLDAFSELEISSLIRHGYGVMRNVSKSHPKLFGVKIPANAPWDPTLASEREARTDKAASQVTTQARCLQASSHRQIFGRLFDYRDWLSYLYLPLLLLLLVGLPMLAYRAYEVSHRSELIVDAITFSNPDFQLVLQLARENPLPGEWEALDVEEVDRVQPPGYQGFRLITDTRILDARALDQDPDAPGHQMIIYRRMLVRRTDQELPLDDDATKPSSKFVIQQFSAGGDISIRSSSTELKPIIRRAPFVQPFSEAGFMYEAEFDLSSVPSGDDFEIGFELSSRGIQGRTDMRKRLTFPIVAPTDVATMWVLLPVHVPYRDFSIVAHRYDRPTMVEAIEPTYRFDMADGALFGWMIVAPREDHVYECRWNLR